MSVGTPGREHFGGTNGMDERKFDAECPEDVAGSGLCCLEGCLTGAGVCVLFVIILPAGILLTVYGSNNGLDTILALGIVLMAAPIISLPVILMVYNNRHRIRKLVKTKVTSNITEPQRF